MTWVRFHEELLQGTKRMIPRSLRFVYMELSFYARAKRGYIVVSKDVPLIDGLRDLIGGDRRELKDALSKFTSGPDPMLFVEELAGERRLHVTKWAKWNPDRDSSSERTKKWRKGRHGDADPPPASGHGDASHGVTVTPEPADGDASHLDPVCHGDTDVTGLPRGPARAHAIISSTLIFSGGVQGDRPPEHRPPAVNPAAATNETGDGDMGYICAAWREGVTSETGRGMSVLTGGSLRAFLGALVAHGPRDPCEAARWARSAGAAYARSKPAKLWAHGFATWLDSGGAEQIAPAPEPEWTPPVAPEPALSPTDASARVAALMAGLAKAKSIPDDPSKTASARGTDP